MNPTLITRTLVFLGVTILECRSYLEALLRPCFLNRSPHWFHATLARTLISDARSDPLYHCGTENSFLYILNFKIMKKGDGVFKLSGNQIVLKTNRVKQKTKRVKTNRVLKQQGKVPRPHNSTLGDNPFDTTN